MLDYGTELRQVSLPYPGVLAYSCGDPAVKILEYNPVLETGHTIEMCNNITSVFTGIP